MVGWHHQPDGHEFEQALGDGDGQGGLVSCGPWDAKSRTGLSDQTAATLQGIQKGNTICIHETHTVL